MGWKSEGKEVENALVQRCMMRSNGEALDVGYIEANSKRLANLVAAFMSSPMEKAIVAIERLCEDR